jgi:glycosyltransferase involved in cell wall biosynthesis
VPDLIISIITVCYNAEHTIDRCISSVINQKYKNVEYIIIDGKSTDGTLNIINQFKEQITVIKSEPDRGIYDAMNKGIKLASGHIIGMINADDYFADDMVLSDVAASFVQQNTDVIYGDLDYVNNEGKIIRKWRSGNFSSGVFNWGWMPPHPTFYCRPQIFEQFGYYSLDYGTAADYELMARFMHLKKVKAFYIKRVVVKMQVGGASNKSLRNRVKVLSFDYNAMKANGILIPVLALLLKPLRKVGQYF